MRLRRNVRGKGYRTAAGGKVEGLILNGINLIAGVVPVPVSGTDWGEFPALSVIVIAAVSAPVVVGSNTTLIVQFAPAARVDPQPLVNLNEVAFVPVIATFEMARVEDPGFVRVADLEAVEVPTGSELNARLVGERVSLVPVPFSKIVFAFVTVLSFKTRFAERAPVAVGLKTKPMLQL
jgi:hypothetical protein